MEITMTENPNLMDQNSPSAPPEDSLPPVPVWQMPTAGEDTPAESSQPEKTYERDNSFSRSIFRLLLCISLLLFFISGYKLFTIYAEYHEGTQSYEDISGTYVTPSSGKPKPTVIPGSPDTQEPEPDTESENPFPIEVDFEGLSAVNKDIVGWLYQEGTVINYPVVQGRDNAYYLKHLFDGTYNSSGTLFLDVNCLSDFSSENSIIYGHHMRNGSMFASLNNYKKQSYYNQHPVLYLMTPDGGYLLEPIAGYITDGYDEIYTISFPGNEVKEALVKRALSRSTFKSQAVFSEEDRLATLSTCTYEYQNATYVLLCKMTPIPLPGEEAGN